MISNIPIYFLQCFTEAFGYERLDLNLPLVLPLRRDGVFRYPWKFDSPITNIGMQINIYWFYQISITS